MSTKAKLVSAFLFLAFVAATIYTTIDLDQYTCELCVEFRGATLCGKGAGTTTDEARQAAVTVACAGVPGGMAEQIACENTPPSVEECSQK